MHKIFILSLAVISFGFVAQARADVQTSDIPKVYKSIAAPFGCFLVAGQGPYIFGVNQEVFYAPSSRPGSTRWRGITTKTTSGRMTRRPSSTIGSTSRSMRSRSRSRRRGSGTTSSRPSGRHG